MPEKKAVNLQRSFAGQVVSYGLVQFIIRLQGLITLPILTRLIGSEGYGNLAPLGALASIGQILITLGAPNSIKIFIPGLPKNQRSKEFWAVFQTNLIAGTVFSLALLALFPLIKTTLLAPNTSPALYFAGVIAIPLSALQAVLYAQIVNNHEGRAYSGIVAIVASTQLIVVTVGAIWFRETGVLYATAIAQMLQLLLMVKQVLKEDPFVLLTRELIPVIKRYYTYGLTLVVAGLSSWIIASSDRFFLVHFSGVRVAGIYDVVYSLSSQLNQLGAPIFAALMPYVAASINLDKPQEARKYFDQSNKILLFVFMPAVILYSITGRDLLRIIATAEFAQAFQIVPYLALAIALWQLVGVYNYNLHAHQRGQVLLISMGVAAAVNVGLNVIFIPQYGMMAAALSTLAAYAVIFVLNGYFSNQSLRIPYDLPYFFRLCIASAGMSLIIYALQIVLADRQPLFRFLSSVSLGGIAYLGLVILLGALSRDEWGKLLDVGRAVFSVNRRGD
jgi:O-antigen/teichoic acid export membrane protein